MMKSTLIFKSAQVALLVNHTKACTEHNPTVEQMFQGVYRRDGKDADPDTIEEWPTPDDVDLTKIPAGLQLVADQGVYLLSNGSPRDIVDGETSRVAYAKDMDPDNEQDNNDWYETKRHVMGGDDQAMFIPLDWVTPQLEKGKTVKIWVKTNGMYVTKFGVG